MSSDRAFHRSVTPVQRHVFGPVWSKGMFLDRCEGRLICYWKRIFTEFNETISVYSVDVDGRSRQMLAPCKAYCPR